MADREAAGREKFSQLEEVLDELSGIDPHSDLVRITGISHPELGVSPQMAVDVFLHLGNHILAGDHRPGQLVDLGDH